jgi:hypothetical protein
MENMDKVTSLITNILSELPETRKYINKPLSELELLFFNENDKQRKKDL